MNIKEIAYQIASVNMKNKCSPAELEDFAEALVAELAKENKPFCFVYPEIADSFIKVSCGTAYRKRSSPEQIALYTLPPTAEQIEQETAEAIAKMCDLIYGDGSAASQAARDGSWRTCK